jgi:hypothetical protein
MKQKVESDGKPIEAVTHYKIQSYKIWHGLTAPEWRNHKGAESTVDDAMRAASEIAKRYCKRHPGEDAPPMRILEVKTTCTVHVELSEMEGGDLY